MQEQLQLNVKQYSVLEKLHVSAVKGHHQVLLRNMNKWVFLYFYSKPVGPKHAAYCKQNIVCQGVILATFNFNMPPRYIE